MEPADRITEPFDGYTELNIFDFDGTLFRSPCPSPKVLYLSFSGPCVVLNSLRFLPHGYYLFIYRFSIFNRVHFSLRQNAVSILP
jgi:hypothetical protein